MNCEWKRNEENLQQAYNSTAGSRHINFLENNIV